MELKTVYVAQGRLVADVIKGKLESAGIPVLLDYESIGPVFGIVVDGIGEVRVKVPVALADEATELLRETPADDEEEER